MSYRISRARKKFETEVEDAVDELLRVYKWAHKNGTGSRLLGVYYVFVFSQLEVYVKSYFEDALGALVTARPKFDRWPDPVLGYLIHKSEKLQASYRRFENDEDEGAILGRVATLARKIGSWKTGTHGLDAVDADEFMDRKTYPSPRNLPQLYRRLGVSSVWAVIGKAGKFNGELILTSLNDLRTGIAHEGRMPPGFGLRDFKDRIGQMRKLVAAIDRGVASNFCPTTITRRDWNRSMS